jgi:hypothetical protein
MTRNLPSDKAIRLLRNLRRFDKVCGLIGEGEYAAKLWLCRMMLELEGQRNKATITDFLTARDN